jgi:PAS domain S-box-containing protein
MFGYSSNELIGQRVELLVPERLRPLHTEHRGAFISHPSVRPMGLGLSLVARRKDGSEFPVEISLSPVETASGNYVIAVVHDITERQQLEEERNHFRMELEMERERDRIGMDLHDGIMQEIYAAGLTLELALGDVQEDVSVASEGIERAIEQLHEVIRNIRSYIFDLRPRQFSGSLANALADLAREFRQNTQIYTLDQLPESLPSVETERIRIEVSDNGDGFDVSQELPQVHRGLRNMSARARVAGATLEIESARGRGTRLQVDLPFVPV